MVLVQFFFCFFFIIKILVSDPLRLRKSVSIFSWWDTSVTDEVPYIIWESQYFMNPLNKCHACVCLSFFDNAEGWITSLDSRVRTRNQQRLHSRNLFSKQIQFLVSLTSCCFFILYKFRDRFKKKKIQLNSTQFVS